MKLSKLSIISTVIILCSCSSSEGYTRYNFRYQHGTKDYDDSAFYDDEFLNESSTVFNPKLASASISLSMASFASTDYKEYAEKSYNAKNLLTDMGFVDFDTNEAFKTKPGADTIGVLAAHKVINNQEVVFFSIRGAAYFSEWASNFTIGNRADCYHDGFYTAATNCLNYLKEYIAKYNISGDIKMWGTAYSRGGATVNLAGGLIDESISKNEKIFGDNITLSKENLYCYCFEPPQGAPNTKDSEGNIIVRGDIYNNIFNIVNLNDPVPLTAMSELGFTRYGVDMYLPDPLTIWDYQEHFENMNSLLSNDGNYDVVGNYKITNFKYKTSLKSSSNSAHNMSQALYIRDLISDLTLNGLTNMGVRPLEECRAYYAEKVQVGLRSLFSTLYLSESFKGSLMDLGTSLVTDLNILNEVDILVSDLTVEGVSAFVNDIRPILTRGLNHLNLGVDIETTISALLEFLKVVGSEMFAAFLDGKSYEFLTLINVDNIKSLGFAHYAELCAAHVKSLDANYVQKPFSALDKMTGRFYRLVVKDIEAPITIKHDDELIVNINHGEELDNNIPYIKKSDEYDIYLPYYEHYEFVVGDDATYQLSYFDPIFNEYIEINPQEVKSNGGFSI